MRVAAIAACCALTLTAGCASKRVVLGEQCPGPTSSRGVAPASDAGSTSVYGTSCAPCDGDGARFDSRGCPMFVTWSSCGGDICIGDHRIPRPQPDAGAEDDAGADEEDGGAD